MTHNNKFQLPRTSPEQQGIASSAVLEFIQAAESQINDLHSVMVLRHGNVIAEAWWSPYQPEHRHMIYSVSKSFTSTAVGLAVTEGYFSIDDAVVSFFPDKVPADADKYLLEMRVRHLLTMTSGHSEDVLGHMAARQDNDWIRGFFEANLPHMPGTTFAYNTGATYMLAAIVQKTTGKKLLDYLTPRLFEPLGIDNPTWDESSEGVALGGIGLKLRTEDIARFGQLYLQNGSWNGQQLIPETWVTEATKQQVSSGNMPESDWGQGYGYQFWRCRHDAYRADGVFGQYCVVMPEQDVVIAITGGTDVFDAQDPLNLIWDILLPAMSAEPLPEDTETHQKLIEKLSSLSLSTVQGEMTSPISAQISGQVYTVDLNEMGIKTITLNFEQAGFTITLKTDLLEETIAGGYGTWQPGQTQLFQGSWLDSLTPTFTSGAWTDEDTFTMVIRLCETPFYHTLVFYFGDDDFMLETWVNASLDENKNLLLTGHRI